MLEPNALLTTSVSKNPSGLARACNLAAGLDLDFTTTLKACSFSRWEHLLRERRVLELNDFFLWKGETFVFSKE